MASDDTEYRPDSLVMLCRSLNISMKDIDENLIKCLNVAMQQGCPSNYQEAIKSADQAKW
jgi:hypothetical protein